MTGIKVNNRIYIQSRGFSNQHDYSWQCCDADIDISSRPPYQNIPGLKQAELNSFSLVLSRSSKGLFLLVSGLPSGRKDIRHRDIRNTVMWSIDEPDDRDEAIFRSLAAFAIRDHCGSSKLTDRINKAIEASKDSGYTVDFELLKPEELTKGLEKQSSTATLSPRELSYSEQNLENIAKEIEKSLLPKHEKNLIAITNNKTQVIVDGGKLHLSVGDVVVEQPMTETLKIESNRSSIPSFDLLGFIHSITTRLSPKLALFVVGVIAGGVLLQNTVTSRQIIATINLEKIEINAIFTGTLNSPEIDKIKLIDSDKKEIVAGVIKSNKNWEIAYKLGSNINCQNQLSIQGFNKGGKAVGESIAIHPLCNK